MQHSAGGTGNLVVGAVRPAMGVLWRAPRQPVAIELPGHVTFGGAVSTWPSRDLSGIHLTPPTVDERHQTPEGLFVGRLESRAWLIELRGSREGDHTVAQLSWDVEHVDPSGLVLQFEEYDDHGELALSQRISFADVGLPELGDGTSAEVRLPTLGPKLRYGLSLYAPDGSLLDRLDPAPFLEEISLEIRTNDAPVIESTIGTPHPTPSFAERLERAAEVRETLAELGRGGAEGRILRDRASGWPRLRRLLESARGELLIADPYFGQEEADWSLLEAFSVPVRVLTCKIADFRAPIPPGVSVRVRPKGTKVLHDRAYAWREGGFLLGGSPSTIGHGPIAVMPLSAPEAELRGLMFEALWTSPYFRALERT